MLFADLPLARRHDAASLAAHYVAGVLDRDSMTGGIEALSEAADFRPGDRVRTRKGVVRRILTDGRIAWLPYGNKAELIALPESLLHER